MSLKFPAYDTIFEEIKEIDEHFMEYDLLYTDKN